MAGKFLNGIMNGPRRAWRQSVEPFRSGSSVRVGVTRGWLGLGRQIPGMQWGGGINIDAERRHLAILASDVSVPANAGLVSTLLQRIQKGKVGFIHLTLNDFIELKATLADLSRQKYNGKLAAIAQNVLTLEGPKYDQAIQTLRSKQQPAQPVAQPDIISRMLAGGQEGTISGLEELGGITTKGGRDANEDAVVVYSNDEVVAIGVFGGIGGNARGEVASRLAAEQAEIAFKAGLSPTALELAHKRIAVVSKVDIKFKGMGSTGIVARINDSQARINSVGDSRAILIRADGAISILTPDDNFYVALYNTSGIPAQEKISGAETLSFPLSGDAILSQYWQAAQKCKNGHILTQSLGQVSTLAENKGEPIALKVSSAVTALAENDLLILCSDGLYDFLSFEEFKTVVEQNKDKTPQEIAQALHDVALKNMNPTEDTGDNITVVVFKQPGTTDVEIMQEDTFDAGAPPALPGEESSVVEAAEASTSGEILNSVSTKFLGLFSDTLTKQLEVAKDIYKGIIVPTPEELVTINGQLQQIISEKEHDNLTDAAILALAMLKQDPTLSIKEKYYNILYDFANPRPTVILMRFIKTDKIAIGPFLTDDVSKVQIFLLDAEAQETSPEVREEAQAFSLRFDPEIKMAIAAQKLDGQEVETPEEEVFEAQEMDPQDAKDLSGQTITLTLPAGPAAQPPAKPEQAAPTTDESTLTRRIDAATAPLLVNDRPQKGVPGVLFTLGDDAEKTQAVNIGPVAAAGLGISKPEPTGPLAALMQAPGLTTDESAVQAALINIIAEAPEITNQQLNQLLANITPLKRFFNAKGNDEMVGLITGAEISLLELDKTRGER